MKRPILLCVGLAGAALLPNSILAQGSLTPPGVPAPTMKSLDQIEARTPISSVPFTINTRGSYYLTGNMTVSGAAAIGITVSSDNVTIDLNGFNLSAGGAGTGSGIFVSATRLNVHVHNGTISGFGNYGI